MSEQYTAIIIELPDDDGVVRIRRQRSPSGDSASLRYLQDIVGGYIEHLCSEDGKVDFWMNEEGKLSNDWPDRINPIATQVLYALLPIMRGEDVLVGNVVLTGNRGPDTVSVPEGFWERLQKAIMPIRGGGVFRVSRLASSWERVVFVDEIEEE